MSDCKYVNLINGDQCIGDSLRVINANFSALEAGLCEEAARQFTASVDINPGDGLRVSKTQEEEQITFSINLENSIQYFRADQLRTNATGVNNRATLTPDVTLEDDIKTKFMIMPWQGTYPAEPASKVGFETVALGSEPPIVTLYWLSSAQSPNVVYATNQHLDSSIRLNGPVYSFTNLKEGDDAAITFINGSFTTTKIYVPKKTNPTDYALRIAPLALAANSTLSGTTGSLTAFRDSVYGENGTSILNIINSNKNSSNRPQGFNNRVNKTVVAQRGNKTYLCVGGLFTGGGNTLLDATTKGLVILDITPGQATRLYEFSLNINPDLGVGVTDLLVVGSYLYVCGLFSTIASVGGTLVQAKSLCRINLDNLKSENINTFIDVVFSTNFNESYRTPGTNKYNIGPGVGIKGANHYIRSLATDINQSYLYVGGNQLRYKLGTNGKLVLANRSLSVHSIEDSTAGKIIDSWECRFTSGSVLSLVVDTILNDNAPNNPIKTVLYALGNFTKVAMGLETSKSPSYKKPYIACFDLIDYDADTGRITQQRSSNPSLNTDWFVSISGPTDKAGVPLGQLLCLATEDSLSNSPLYIGGYFNKINGRSISNLAAISKPTQIGGRAVRYNWDMKVNGKVRAIKTILANSPLNTGITPPENKKVSLLIGGEFKKVSGLTKPYLARVSCYNQVPFTVPLSSVVWEVAGQSLQEGGSISLNADLSLATSTSANPVDCINVTTFPPLVYGFEDLQRGDICKFVISRPLQTGNLNDEYAKPVHLIGIKVDFNTIDEETDFAVESTEQIVEEDLPDEPATP